MKRTFRFRYEQEPDTGWTMTLTGEVQAETLEEAWSAVGDALGDGLWRSVCRNLSEDWTVAIVFPGGHVEPVYECEFCEGTGCGSCEARGFRYERGLAAAQALEAQP